MISKNPLFKVIFFLRARADVANWNERATDLFVSIEVSIQFELKQTGLNNPFISIRIELKRTSDRAVRFNPIRIETNGRLGRYERATGPFISIGFNPIRIETNRLERPVRFNSNWTETDGSVACLFQSNSNWNKRVVLKPVCFNSNWIETSILKNGSVVRSFQLATSTHARKKM